MSIYTTESFIARCKEIHIDSGISYEKTVFTTTRQKITLTCKQHGDFAQVANSHLRGYGCNKCAHQRTAIAQTHNTNDFIEKSKFIHGNKFDYTDTIYINSHHKVNIQCKLHGAFWQLPGNHLNKSKRGGCPVCAPLLSGITHYSG